MISINTPLNCLMNAMSPVKKPLKFKGILWIDLNLLFLCEEPNTN